MKNLWHFLSKLILLVLCSLQISNAFVTSNIPSLTTFPTNSSTIHSDSSSYKNERLEWILGSKESVTIKCNSDIPFLVSFTYPEKNQFAVQAKNPFLVTNASKKETSNTSSIQNLPSSTNNSENLAIKVKKSEKSPSTQTHISDEKNQSKALTKTIYANNTSVTMLSLGRNVIIVRNLGKSPATLSITRGEGKPLAGNLQIEVSENQQGPIINISGSKSFSLVLVCWSIMMLLIVIVACFATYYKKYKERMLKERLEFYYNSAIATSSENVDHLYAFFKGIGSVMDIKGSHHRHTFHATKGDQ